MIVIAADAYVLPRGRPSDTHVARGRTSVQLRRSMANVRSVAWSSPSSAVTNRSRNARGALPLRNMILAFMGYRSTRLQQNVALRASRPQRRRIAGAATTRPVGCHSAHERQPRGAGEPPVSLSQFVYCTRDGPAHQLSIIIGISHHGIPMQTHVSGSVLAL